MKSHEQFLKDVEADIARLNAALADDDDCDDLEEDDLMTDHTEQVEDVGTEDFEQVSSEILETKPDPLLISDLDTTTVDSRAATEATEEIDTAAMLRENEDLLRQIDTVLAKRHKIDTVLDADIPGSEYHQFGMLDDQQPEIPSKEEEDEEEEDYFRYMDQFVESDTAVDREKLDDVLDMNLQFQDFLVKMIAEIERRLAKNKEKQTAISDEQDHMFLVSQGYLETNMGTRPPSCKVLSLQKFKAPYFSNFYKDGPLMNQDQIRLSHNPRSLVFTYESGWGKNDRSNLQDCLKLAIIDEKMTDFMTTKSKDEADLYHEKLQSTTLDQLLRETDVSTWGDHQWEEVAMSMKSISCSRSRGDVMNQWNNYLSPEVKKSDWTSSENRKLEELVSTHGTNNWQLVASLLKSGRKPWQCLQRYQKTRKKVSTQFSVVDDKHLMDAVMIYGDASFADLSYYLGDKTSDQCLQRWRYSICPQIKRGKWTQEEDAEIMSIISEHGYDWQKIKDVQKQRTRAQVRERVRILMAKEISGSNGGTRLWSVEESIQLMQLVAKHGARNWSLVKKGMQDRYTAAVLFRRWGRISSLLNGSIKRVSLAWERIFLNELLNPRRYLTKKVREEVKFMLPDAAAKERIEVLLERAQAINGKTALFPAQLKRRMEELGTMEEGSQMCTADRVMTGPGGGAGDGNNIFSLLRNDAGDIYRKAFEVDNGPEFKMYYTPPSVTTLSAFRSLLIDQIPTLREQAGADTLNDVELPDETLQSEEFNLLAARFKSLFSWPLVMGETPV